MLYRLIVYGLVFLASISNLESRAGSRNPLPTTSPLQTTTPMTVLENGVIRTMDATYTTAEAIAIKDGAIVAIGANAEVRLAVGDNPNVIDLGGRAVLPGLHDVHNHLLVGFSPVATCELDVNKPPSGQVERLKDCASQDSFTKWAIGSAFDITTFLESGENPLPILDAAFPDRPALMQEATSHAAWVNSRALATLEIDHTTPDPPGGIIVKDANGNPNGLLLDNAGDIGGQLAFAPTPILALLNDVSVLTGLGELARNGITSMADARVFWQRGHHEAYLRAEAAGRLTARVVLGLWGYPEMDDDNQLAALTALYSNDPNRLVRASQVKVYIDGIHDNTTARTLTEYIVDYGFNTPLGLNYFDEDRLTRYIAELERVGFDFHIHALGAGGAREALNAIERAGAINPDLSDRRHRLTHVASVHPDDIPRFAALGAIADVQLVSEAQTHANGLARLIDFLGPNIAVLPWPIRQLIDAKATVTLSSDFDVSPLNPFLGMHNAVNRPQFSMTIDEAVRAYTINAAFLMRHEDRTGSLEVGKRADLVVLDQDPYTINPANLRETRVLLTLFDGQEVFRDERF